MIKKDGNPRKAGSGGVRENSGRKAVTHDTKITHQTKLSFLGNDRTDNNQHVENQQEENILPLAAAPPAQIQQPVYYPQPPSIDYFSAFNKAQYSAFVPEDPDQLEELVAREEAVLTSNSFIKEYLQTVILDVKNEFSGAYKGLKRGEFWIFPREPICQISGVLTFQKLFS
jgi:hypothetical protein